MNEKSKKMNTKRQLQVTIIVMVIVAFLASTLLAVAMFAFLNKFGILPNSFLQVMLSVFIACIVVGFTISGFFFSAVVSPIINLSEATEKVARGDFSVRLELPNGHWSERSGVKRLTENFNNMVREIDGTKSFRDDFISYFSHEFKTPIVSVRGFARQLCSEDVTDNEVKEYSKIILDESERLADMSSNILLIMKFENQGIIGNKTSYRLDEQLRRCMLMLEKRWSEKNLSVAMDLNNITYYQNEDVVAHIWNNLIGNAIKFTEEGGEISVTCREDGSDIVVAVKDNGIGMDEETIKHIFDKFYQCGSSAHNGGSGLGLSIVKRITEILGGTVSVKSAPGEGSEFTVRLPKTS